MGLLDGRVVIVTGAGGGIGRAHALAFAAEGARVVVNDIGVGLDGSPAGGGSAAQAVVDEIRTVGGQAVASGADVADWDQAAGLIRTAIDEFGGLDVLVNNAGIVRDRMIANTSEEEFDAVIAVHLKGHFATMRHAAAHWRALSKEGGTVDGRIINTSSGAGLQGSVGQGNYSAAKAGIAALTLVAAAEMGRYGVTVNAIAPSARTRMTETVFADMMSKPETGFDAMAAENISPLVVWLGSAESADITGRVFEVEGGIIRAAEGWQHGAEVDKGAVGARRARTRREKPAGAGPSARCGVRRLNQMVVAGFCHSSRTPRTTT
jgi:NAD(P)-dependent dehydrogenase (short-subunit alcohol dehydrogenase family)